MISKYLFPLFEKRRYVQLAPVTLPLASPGRGLIAACVCRCGESVGFLEIHLFFLSMHLMNGSLCKYSSVFAVDGGAVSFPPLQFMCMFLYFAVICIVCKSFLNIQISTTFLCYFLSWKLIVAIFSFIIFSAHYAKASIGNESPENTFVKSWTIWLESIYRRGERLFLAMRSSVEQNFIRRKFILFYDNHNIKR